jgi:hypothetical protein
VVLEYFKIKYREILGCNEILWKDTLFKFEFKIFLLNLTFRIAINYKKCGRHAFIFFLLSTDSAVSTAAGYGQDGSSSPGRAKIFLLSTSSRLVLGPTLPPIQWARGLFSRGKAAGT